MTSRKQTEQIEKRGLHGTVALRHGSLCLMSGWFQRDFVHSTIAAREWGSCWAKDQPARKKCRVAPAPLMPRINVTGRWIRKHKAFCPVSVRAPVPLCSRPSTVAPREVSDALPMPARGGGTKEIGVQTSLPAEVEALSLDADMLRGMIGWYAEVEKSLRARIQCQQEEFQRYEQLIAERKE